MEIRPANENDLPEILRVFECARKFMRGNGNPNQWGTNRPAVTTLEEDVRLGRMYVLVEKRVCACFAYYAGPDPTYSVIRDGSWPNNESYDVVHRIASDGSVHGFIKTMVEYCSKKSSILRIDTHEDNKIMQHLLAKNGFVRCGIINTDDGTERIAYQKG